MSFTRHLSSLLIAASMLTGACASSSRPVSHEPVAVDPIVRPVKIDRAKLRAALAARRTATYARFLAYREARVYPVNDADGFEHVWLDAFGHLCAAATMINADWGFVPTANVAVMDNHVALATVKDGALHDWILTSGMTHHEIVAIQRPGFREPPEQAVLPDEPAPVDPRIAEVQRLYDGYIDVERQLVSLWDEALDEATDALMARPDLARQMIGGIAAGPGEFAAAPDRVTVGFAKPPA